MSPIPFKTLTILWVERNSKLSEMRFKAITMAPLRAGF